VGKYANQRGKKPARGGKGRRSAYPLDDAELLTIRLPAVSTELEPPLVEGPVVEADEPTPTARLPKARRNTLAEATGAVPAAPRATAPPERTTERPSVRPDAPTVKVPKPKRARVTMVMAPEAEPPAEIARRRQTVLPPASDEALLAITTRRTTQLPALKTTASPAVRPTSASGLSTSPARITAPLVIPGSGRVHAFRYLPARKRPLVMRVAVLVATICIVTAGLFAVLPLTGGSADDAQHTSAFQAIANAVLWRGSPGYRWYTVQNGDTLESLRDKFHVQIGGIYELNGMLSGEELQVGKAYKIPTDSNYGLYYRPSNYQPSFSGTNTNGVGYYGPTIYTDQIWSTMAGMPPDGALCGPAPKITASNPSSYDPNNLANYDPNSFDLKAPNWGAYWVRGFTWYHFGVDLANPEGTPIHAAQSGEVIFAAWDTGGGGWSVKINHCNHLSTAYGHMDQLLVKVHQMVRVGDVIGLEGSTGWSTGPHLHFSCQWNNAAVDPMQFFNWSQYNITHPLPDV
jgi:murein DD-endopeptidase MepM/ murein hydrolase activator NlpD